MALGNTQSIIEKSRLTVPEDSMISERAFNLIIGAMLMWGFLLNYVTVAVFGRQVSAMVSRINPIVFLIGYLVLVFAGNAMVVKGGPALSFVGYTLIAAPIGIVVCLSVEGVPASVVESAVLITAIVTLSFMIAGTLFPGFFLRLGRVLLFSLLFTLVGGLISLLLFGARSYMVYEWVGTAVFSLYIGYDWARANTCARTVDNAIDLSASLYLDIINLFLRILRIMNRNRK